MSKTVGVEGPRSLDLRRESGLGTLTDPDYRFGVILAKDPTVLRRRKRHTRDRPFSSKGVSSTLRVPRVTRLFGTSLFKTTYLGVVTPTVNT